MAQPTKMEIREKKMGTKIQQVTQETVAQAEAPAVVMDLVMDRATALVLDQEKVEAFHTNLITEK